MKEIERHMNYAWLDINNTIDMRLRDNIRIYLEWLVCEDKIEFNEYYYRLKKRENRKKIMEKLIWE